MSIAGIDEKHIGNATINEPDKGKLVVSKIGKTEKIRQRCNPRYRGKRDRGECGNKEQC